MKCPYCGENRSIPVDAALNVTTYQQPKLVSMPCCNRLVRISPVELFRVDPVINTKKHCDDWGRDCILSSEKDIQDKEPQYCKS